MSLTEQAIVFPCAGNELLGIVTLPEQSGGTGVLVVVGGPQYRVGSHRQFLLLSRALASAGYPVMRFDCCGMGDSSGELADFQGLNGDISAAITAFQKQCPTISNVVLWGLCDAASASLLYWDATHDSRIAGLVLLNPWVRSEATLAKTHIKHYYGQRLLQVEFWRKLLTGNLGIGRALGGFVASFVQARRASDLTTGAAVLPFQTKMMRALKEFQGQVLLILSGDDYTAKEFIEAIQADSEGAAALENSRLRRVDIAGADHTFSSAEWRQSVEAMTISWIETSVRVVDYAK
ncbi:hydrolase 1, exosortase A system-associated [Dechloromonas denitrificans]|uniref:hydrolase 1, exosortase A system-associated n=1 Tax=Dechloromonas denitrificans TaxID=281362 RepID=UPI001CF83FCD|nr:hydrolase 1, exosortase A system-associated [Dechloromonas denitrificans]UCV01945.1 hydrolase 1, exosortase A system-associated [Dechloromonas denitrificans]UCV06279.1 hydrolase 1, exosortase A system-associated [Dechloromonas denitrificans]